MNPDEPDLPIYCARCFQVLRVGLDETLCNNPKCDALIESREDYLTHDQWCERRAIDRRAWSEAEASGLIVPRSGEARGAEGVG